MTDTASTKPEKESAPRFHVLGPIGDPALFVVLDRTVGTAGADWVQGAAACFPSAWGDPEARAKRVAYALNTMQRLIGDPDEPYYVEDISQAADALAELSTASTLRSMQAMGMGETETALMFGAEGRAATHGSTMLRRLQAELLKFALVADTIDGQARAWVEAQHGVDDDGFETLSVAAFLDAVREAYVAGMIAGQMATAQGEPRS